MRTFFLHWPTNSGKTYSVHCLYWFEQLRTYIHGQLLKTDCIVVEMYAEHVICSEWNMKKMRKEPFSVLLVFGWGVGGTFRTAFGQKRQKTVQHGKRADFLSNLRVGLQACKCECHFFFARTALAACDAAYLSHHAIIVISHFTDTGEWFAVKFCWSQKLTKITKNPKGLVKEFF